MTKTVEMSTSLSRSMNHNLHQSKYFLSSQHINLLSSCAKNACKTGSGNQPTSSIPNDLLDVKIGKSSTQNCTEPAFEWENVSDNFVSLTVIAEAAFRALTTVENFGTGFGSKISNVGERSGPAS